ncbi:MAG: hypothetical protein U1C66_00365 [Patescibacteria group bacterium]|nr:hypothetical protein [Patescibacteria group bacterium]
MYDLLIRELELSRTARESQYAIYAADTGVECALYWDFKYGTVNPSDIDGSAFATSSAQTDKAGAGQALCDGQDITNNSIIPFVWTIVTNAPTTTTTFKISSDTVAGPCATVTVAKAGNPPSTVITSRGYNTCLDTGQVQIERALEVNY